MCIRDRSFIYDSGDTDKGSYACAGAATHIESAAKAVAKVHPPTPPVAPMRWVCGKELGSLKRARWLSFPKCFERQLRRYLV